MEYFYYVTEEKRRWWAKEKFAKDFCDLLKRFEKSHVDIQMGYGESSILRDDFIMSKFPGKHSRPTFIWKKMIYKDGVCIYVLRDAMRHDVYIAQITQGTEATYVAKKELSPQEKNELNSFHDKIIEDRSKTDYQEKNPLSGNEVSFISSPLSINCNLFKDAVYETKEWIDDIIGTEENDSFDEFSKAAQAISNHIYEHLVDDDGWEKISIKDRILLIYHKSSNWILAAAPRKTETERIEKILKGGEPENYMRGYPQSFLYLDDDEWRRMEQDSKSNLVLTEEQVAVVSNSEPNYPLFISGRAGSGKSTVLQYLFAEIVLRFQLNKDAFDCPQLLPPVYLSYSKTLIEDAKKLSQTLFDKNNVYKEIMKKHSVSYKKDIQPSLKNMFYVFKDLLKKCIQDYDKEILETKFSDEKYISFAVFKKKWSERFGKDRDAVKNFGPSICWHIIRTYIKGWNNDSYLTPDDYEALGRNYLTVSIDTFKKVYDVVWDKWYKDLTSDKYWDDQDLVKYCLEKGYAKEQFSAIYCDEAQDFTRIEIDFILKVSLFSNRKIENVDDVKKLPFVFAGDEFQTLNPTGFSWDSLRSYFVNSIFEMTGLGDKKDESKLPRPIEFNENFRSTAQIVRLANRVQLLRASRLNEFSYPQTPHFSIDGPSIYCVSPNDYTIWDAIPGNLVNMIIPIAEGESVEDYIKNSPLKDKINFENGIPQGLTILSPSQAKGCEYANVIIYGFNTEGNNCKFKVQELLEWFANPKEDIEGDIELKYQVCNAYVAVTRATSRIFILDEFTMNSFWAFAFNDSTSANRKAIMSLQSKMIESLDTKKNAWEDDGNLGWINAHPAEEISFAQLKVRDVFEELDKMKNNALLRSDASMMRMVACRYKERNSKEKYAECMAWAFVFEGKRMAAADFFVKAKQADKALDNYWEELAENKNTDEIVKEIIKLNGHVNDIRQQTCMIAMGAMVVDDLKEVLANCLSSKDKANFLLNSWQKIVNVAVKHISYGHNLSIDKNLDNINNLKEELGKINIKVDLSPLALVAFNNKELAGAIKLWEMSTPPYPKEYYNAKYNITSFPENIEYAPRMGNPDWGNLLLTDWKNYGKNDLNENQLVILCSALKQDLNSSDLLFNKMLPFMVNHIGSLNEYADFKEIIKKRHLVLPYLQSLDALFMIRYGDISTWKAPVENFVDSDTVVFIKAIKNIQEFKTKAFKKKLDLWFGSSKTKLEETLSEYKQFDRKQLAPLVFIELGKIIEHRTKIVDALKYYSTIREMVNSPKLRREFDVRWIACKEKLAIVTNSSQHSDEAHEKRVELSLGSEQIPEVAEVSQEEWNKLFKVAMELDFTVFDGKKDVQQQEHADVPKINCPSYPANVKFSENKQVISVGDYTLTYFPKKHEVKIEYSSNVAEYSIKINKGKLTDNDEFYLKDNRLFLTDNDSMTPFSIRKFDSLLWVEIYDGLLPTGMYVVTKAE